MPVQDNSGLTPAQLGALIVEGYTAPRASMARILSMQPDERARLLMVGFGIAISALGVALFNTPDPEAGPRNPILSYLVTIVAGFLQYVVFSWIIGLVCSFAGGAGERDDNRTLVAWWALVTAPLPVVMMAALLAQSPIAAFVLIVAAVLSFVLLAAYIAETHQFKSTARVCGVMLALLMVFSFVMSSLVPMPVPA